MFSTGMAQAVTFAGEFMTSWSGCSCSGSGLEHTDDQINQWAGTMRSLGHQQLWVYANTEAWACDITEDGLGGCDWPYGDDAGIYAFAGHGYNPTDANGRMTFTASFCQGGSGGLSCVFDSKNARWGERAGGYETPHPGNMRWALMLTCRSVDSDPPNQWNEVFEYGFDYIMGYRGDSCDSWTTEEVPSDWANSAFGEAKNFSAAWFTAVEDWWCGDTGGVAASGISPEAARARRDFTNKFVGRRPNSEVHRYIEYAYHSG